MAKSTILVKFPNQPLSYMEIPTDSISEVAESISGLRYATVDILSLYGGFYYVIMDRERNQKRLPYNMTIFFVEKSGAGAPMEVNGPFAICKLPKGLMSKLGNMTPGDVEQVQKLLKK